MVIYMFCEKPEHSRQNKRLFCIMVNVYSVNAQYKENKPTQNAFYRQNKY